MIPATVPQALDAEIAALAARFRRANGPVMQVAIRLGDALERQIGLVPDAVRGQLEQATERALGLAYGAAVRTPELGARGQVAAVMATGAAGGAGGLATALAELPVTVALILNAVRGEARAAGLDPDAAGLREECLRVFTAGSPLASDDGVNTSFLTARLALTGPAVQNLIRSIAPKLAVVLGQKLAAQAVPVLGALTGAALNAAFLNYYREIARIRFALLKLAEVHGADVVLAAFARAVEPSVIIRA